LVVANSLATLDSTALHAQVCAALQSDGIEGPAQRDKRILNLAIESEFGVIDFESERDVL